MTLVDERGAKALDTFLHEVANKGLAVTPLDEQREMAAEIERLRSQSYKLYVWRKQPLYVVMAHATSIARARELALEESKGCGDDSTPVRRQAYEAVRTTAPEIHYRENAEFVLTDSAELQEAEHEIEELKVLLTSALSLLGDDGLRRQERMFLREAVRKHGVKV